MPPVLQMHRSCTGIVGHLRQDIFSANEKLLLFGSDPCRVPGMDWIQTSVPDPRIRKVFRLSDTDQ